MIATDTLSKIKRLPKPDLDKYHTEGFLVYPSYYEAVERWEEQQMIIKALEELRDRYE